MEVNFFAPVEFIRDALPLLREGTHPLVVNIGSILGDAAARIKSEYSASKFAIHGFSEAMRPEFAKLGIDVLVVAAGPTESEHFDMLLEGDKACLGATRRGSLRRMSPEQSFAELSMAGTRSSRAGAAACSLLLNRLTPRLVDRIMARFG